MACGRKGPRQAGLFGICWSGNSNRPPQRLRKDGDRWHGKGRVDRGLLSKKDSTGKLVWYVRLYHEGKERRFGSFKSKTNARDFYEKAKQEQKQGRFFPERYRHAKFESVKGFLEAYVQTLSHSGKQPKTVADERFYARWWTNKLHGKQLHHITPTLLDEAMRELHEKGYAPGSRRCLERHRRAAA